MKEENNQEILAMREMVRNLKFCAGFLARHFDAAVQELENHEAELTAQLEPTHLTDDRQETLRWVRATHSIHSC
jgi:hypothetical protein